MYHQLHALIHMHVIHHACTCMTQQFYTATCSCITKQAVDKMDLMAALSEDSPPTSLGDASKVLGREVQREVLLVKVQKSSHHQSFMVPVVDSPIAGYDALLGQDNMAVTCNICCGDANHPT
jgi:hypothetical protein